MNGIIYAALGTLFTFMVTTLGALNVFWLKKEISNNVQCMFLGFAGGVMIAASIWSLLLPGIDKANENNQIGWLVVSIGFIMGVILLLWVDRMIRQKYVDLKRNDEKHAHSLFKGINKKTAMLILAITVHNIPEGMAVGVAFSLAAQDMNNTNLLSGAIALAIGIGIQNYPEGTAVALPLIKEGFSKKRAFLVGSLSAVVEPVFGILAALIAGVVQSMMPILLAFAAGTMIYVVVEELIPEAHMGERENIGTLGFIVGFLIMMILDVALSF